MSTPESPDDRRSFASRTPVNDNPEKVVYRRGFVTRHQVTGWRFVMRRIASGVALHDTRMLVDPLRTQTRAVLMGVIVLVTALVGCFVFSLIRPNGSAANNPILADRSTAALYVRVGDQLHPVLNLASARLIAGKSANPTQVKSSELDKFPLGNLIGIPGAPQRLVQNTRKDADWTVCDAASGTAAGVTVIAGAPDSTGARAAALETGKAVLVSNPSSAWLLWDGRRSRIDLADHAVTNALGLGNDIHAAASCRPRSVQCDSRVAATGRTRHPRSRRPRPIPGRPPRSAVSSNLMRWKATRPTTTQCYRTDCSRSRRCWPRSCATPTPTAWTSRRGWAPTRWPNCRFPGSWTPAATPSSASACSMRRTTPSPARTGARPSGASTNSLTLLAGSALPIPDAVHTEDLVGAGAGGTANRIAMAPGTGYFAQTVGQNASSPAAGSLFWISDTGVRYGIDNEAAQGGVTGNAKTAEALGVGAAGHSDSLVGPVAVRPRAHTVAVRRAART